MTERWGKADIVQALGSERVYDALLRCRFRTSSSSASLVLSGTFENTKLKMIDAEQVAAMLYSAATSTAKPGPIPTVIRTFCSPLLCRPPRSDTAH